MRPAGRPIKYALEMRKQILTEYINAPKGMKQDIADKYGIAYKSLLAYICKWRKECNMPAAKRERHIVEPPAIVYPPEFY